jgi:hypothetical protein
MASWLVQISPAAFHVRPELAKCSSCPTLHNKAVLVERGSVL